MVQLARRGLVTLLLGAAAATVAACASTGDPEEKSATDSAALSEALQIASTQYLGKIANGETRDITYTARPSFQSYAFEAKSGDVITARVDAAGADAMAWITDEDLRVLAANDDAAPGTLNALVSYRVPYGRTSQSYRVVFREYGYKKGTIRTSLSIVVAAGVCAYSGQTYNPGDSFESIDGCNTCSCDGSGAVSCGSLVCDCNPAKEPWHTYYGAPSQCLQLLYSCPPGEHTFANTCGCGCERPH